MYRFWCNRYDMICSGDDKMNIYDYFKSADVAEHCKSIGHRFNTIEMSWIIDQSDKTINQICKALVV